jgi:hypothetical protein
MRVGSSCRAWRPNFGVKLARPDFGPAAELPTSSPASRRHGGCSSPFCSSNVIGGNHRAASASARGTGRAAYTKDVGQTNSSAYDERVERLRHARRTTARVIATRAVERALFSTPRAPLEEGIAYAGQVVTFMLEQLEEALTSGVAAGIFDIR